MMDYIVNSLNELVKKVGEFPHFDFIDRVESSALREEDKRGMLRWYRARHNDSFHEPATIAAIRFMQQRFGGGLFFDVGAHFGYFSIKAKAMDKRTTCIPVEPNGFFQNMMRALLRDEVQNGINALVSDHDNKKATVWANQFDVFEEPLGGWDNLPPRSARKGFGAFIDNVHIAKLDTIAENCGVPDFVKIDVEGHQTKAVHGMRGLLSGPSPAVIIELHDADKLSIFDTTNEETVTPFFEAGYSGWWCGNHRSMNAVFKPFNDMSKDMNKLSLAVFMKGKIGT
jgi:FkbM family methyltransferase